MSKYDELCAQAEKALEGVTEGPWFPGGVNGGGRPTLVYCDDATGSAVADTVLQFVHRREGECEANATFIAFTRAWVPAAAAAIREVEAERDHIREQRNFTQRQVVFAEAKVAELTRERDDFQACALSWAEKASHTFAIKASLAAAEARVAELEAQRDAEPAAWMRRWFFDKNEGTKGNRPPGWYLHAVTVLKALPDDVPLYLHPAPDAVQAARNDALREAAELVDRRHRGNLPEHIKSEDGNAIRALINNNNVDR
jgi:hypothetical protein